MRLSDKSVKRLFELYQPIKLLEEIGYILDLPVGTVKSRLHHARKALRDRLGSQEASPMEAVYGTAY